MSAGFLFLQRRLTRLLLVNLENRVFHKNWFFHTSGWNWGGLGVSGGSARSIRNFSLELWQDLVLHGIRNFTFQHLTANWNFNVLGMAFKTFHIIHGLSRTPVLFSPRYPTTRFPQNIPHVIVFYRKSKIRFTDQQVKVSLFVSARTVPGTGTLFQVPATR